ncbi:protein precursor [Diplodia corticola]|uniref:Protein n=1 Tax=Diplodia corticola TaxID=236234 RepID=A0A1J9QW02_9PEZI|nr:protein precursor [Diplodia corticola]OJD32592.1 protein precursor [Diplodia corticola]
MVHFSAIFLAAVATMTPLVSAACSVDIINFNQVAVGHACIPANGEGDIVVASTKKTYTVLTSESCGLSLRAQALPANWSLQYKGSC